MTLPELLSDPVRARIYLEVLIKQEVTAQQLLNNIKISRSTMSHHLSRFVEEKVFQVRVQEMGRAIKFYSHNPDFMEEVCIEGKDTIALEERIMFLKSASAHLHIVSNLLQAKADRIEKNQSSSEMKSRVAFTFDFMSKEAADIWNEEYNAFLARFEERRKSVKESSKGAREYIGYGGITPTK
ncbi:MAG: ArsR/SmtB family transcription factor [Candidatus Thorarchaeota archaeon]